MPSISPRNISLKDALDQIKNGTLVIPDFQRKFVWDPESVRELLVSIVGNYYIGSLLAIPSSSSNPAFAISLVEGVSVVSPSTRFQNQVNIVLDGQQRLTSIFYAFYQPSGMTLKNQKNPYKYFLNINKAINGHNFVDESIEGVSTNHKNRLSTLLNDPDNIEISNFLDIAYIVNKYQNDSRLNKIVQLQQQVITFNITILDLPIATTLIQIVETFERINRTGKPLTIFELLSAKLYQNEIKLNVLLEKSIDEYPSIEFIQPENILRILCFIRNIDYSRANILELNSDKFIEDWNRACKAYNLAYNRISDSQSGYGVYDLNRIMPFSSMIVPLSAALLFVKENNLENSDSFKKINKWYWVSVFGERYTQSTNAVSYSDYKDLKEYVEYHKVPSFITQFNIDSVDFDSNSNGSAIYRGVFCLLVINQVKDYYTSQSIKIEPDRVQDDHIFPKSIYKDDSVLNRTLISTNQKKSNKKPSVYFEDLNNKIGSQKLHEVLRSHLVSESGLVALMNNDLDALKKDRLKNIKELLCGLLA